jgi:hypothetical protein
MGRMGETPLCVMCRSRPAADPWRPFCSERCRTEDLARWAEGRYRIAGEPAHPPEPDATDAD